MAGHAVGADLPHAGQHLARAAGHAIGRQPDRLDHGALVGFHPVEGLEIDASGQLAGAIVAVGHAVAVDQHGQAGGRIRRGLQRASQRPVGLGRPAQRLQAGGLDVVHVAVLAGQHRPDHLECRGRVTGEQQPGQAHARDRHHPAPARPRARNRPAPRRGGRRCHRAGGPAATRTWIAGARSTTWRPGQGVAACPSWSRVLTTSRRKSSSPR